jgi:DNA replication protein DnaC
MLFEQTMEQLRSLKLHAMAQAFEDQRTKPEFHNYSFEDRLGLGVSREIQERENRRIQSLEKKAKLNSTACAEDINYSFQRGLDRRLIMSLLTCDYIKNSINVILTGPTGVGKSFIGKALGRQAIRKGLTVRCERLEPLLVKMAIAHDDGSLLTLRAELGKANLLILDDWGMPPLTIAHQRYDLLELIEARTGNGSTLITSQYPVDKWHDIIGDATVADAILDRLIHRSHRIGLCGDSLRRLEGPPPTTPAAALAIPDLAVSDA